MDSVNSSSRRSNSQNLQQILKRPYLLPIGVVGLVIIGLLVFTFRSAGKSTPVLGSNDSKVSIEDAKKTQDINKAFDFPLKDSTGKEVSKIKYQIVNAEIRDEIIVKGQRAKAVNGRTFLVLNVKLTNTFDKAIQITSRDYVRLIVDNSSEKIAADIHNDPIEVQPISTKSTRLAFPIDDKKQSLKLQVGEINGKKEIIELKLY